jgi:hypothetical protein
MNILEDADYTDYWKHIGRDRFEDQAYYGGELDNNRDHYDLISAGGEDFILYMGWMMDQETFDWANEGLQQHKDRKAIVGVHAYINTKGNYGRQGKEIMEKVIAPNENVFMVVSGHYHGAIHNIKRINGKVVYEVLQDYQNGPFGGEGFMRLLHFDIENEQIYMNTYSPYREEFNYYDESTDQFTIPMNLRKGPIKLATDYVAVKSVDYQELGVVERIPSGERASVQLTGLEEVAVIDWLVIAEDPYGNSTRSQQWTFNVTVVIATAIGAGDEGVTIELDGLSHGPHDLQVKAADASGNESTKTDVPKIIVVKPPGL